MLNGRGRRWLQRVLTWSVSARGSGEAEEPRLLLGTPTPPVLKMVR